MKKVIIFHGTECTPELFWYPWLKSSLVEKGYDVNVPYYKDINQEPIDSFLPKVMKEHTFDGQTILIGHSAGSPLILSILESISAPIKQAILVAAYARIKGEEQQPDVVLQRQYDWEKIAGNVEDFIIINSDNDPWGCNDKEGRFILDNIEKGKLIIAKGEGHMGSRDYNQPYLEFPFLLDIIK